MWLKKKPQECLNERLKAHHLAKVENRAHKQIENGIERFIHLNCKCELCS